jgi:hypothetical protein
MQMATASLTELSALSFAIGRCERPISDFWAVDPAGESINVNSLDEVPDSSWFQKTAWADSR